MNKEQAINQLIGFRNDCKNFKCVGAIDKDVEALDVAIEALKDTSKKVDLEQIRKNRLALILSSIGIVASIIALIV